VTRTEIVKAAATRSGHLAATLDAEYSKQMTRSSKTAAAPDDRKKKTAATDDRGGEIAVAALDELRRRPKRRPRRDRRAGAVCSRRRTETDCGSGRNSWERERRTLTLKSGFVYYAMNNTCIHLRVEGSDIYMYRRGRIYKEPHREIQ
jgi:hypothetical protein